MKGFLYPPFLTSLVFWSTIIFLTISFSSCGDNQETISSWYNGQAKEVRYYEPEKENRSYKYFQVVYHENGQKASEGLWVGNQKHGPWMEWYESGQLKFSGQFKEGLPFGTSLSYHKNGVIQEMAQYDYSGQLTGDVLILSESGKTLMKATYNMGKVIDNWE